MQSIITINGQIGVIKFQDQANDDSACSIGRCVRARECLSAVADHKKKIRKAVVCRFENNINESFICCSPSDLERSQNNTNNIRGVRKSLNLTECLGSYLEFRSKRPVDVYFAVNGVQADRKEFANIVS